MWIIPFLQLTWTSHATRILPNVTSTGCPREDGTSSLLDWGNVPKTLPYKSCRTRLRHTVINLLIRAALKVLENIITQSHTRVCVHTCKMRYCQHSTSKCIWQPSMSWPQRQNWQLVSHSAVERWDNTNMRRQPYHNTHAHVHRHTLPIQNKAWWDKEALRISIKKVHTSRLTSSNYLNTF